MPSPPDGPSGAVDLSVVIAVRNEREHLADQLDALAGQSWDGTWEVVVADNGSTDGTAELVADRAANDPRLRLVAVPDARGAGAVRNAGAAAARGAAIAMCDADDLVGPEWVEAMGDALHAHPCVTGPLEVLRLNPPWLVRTRGVPPPDRPMTFHGAFALLPAGNFGMRRALWDRLGGFDPALVTHEDADLARRVHTAGIPVAFAPRALVHYRYRSGARILFRQGFRYGRDRPLVVRRCREAGTRIPRFAGWKSWVALVARLPSLRSRHGRAGYAWIAGVRLGLVVGNVRARTLYL